MDVGDPNRHLPPTSGYALRILAANLPDHLFAQLEQAIYGQQGLALVGQVYGNLNTLEAATGGVDLIVLGAATVYPLPGICTHLLQEFPHLKLIVLSTDDTITEDGNIAALYWLNLEQLEIPEISVAGLREAIQTAAQL